MLNRNDTTKMETDIHLALNARRERVLQKAQGTEMLIDTLNKQIDKLQETFEKHHQLSFVSSLLAYPLDAHTH